MGTSKQLFAFRGESLIRHAAKVALESFCDRVVVVVGSHASEMRQELDDLRVTVVENENWQSGMSSSIRAGLEAITTDDCDGVVIALCDQPFVTANLLNELIETHRNTGKPIVASSYGATIGVPAFFSRELFPELKSLSADEGARRIIAAQPESVATITFPEGAIDIDTRQDYERAKTKITSG